MSILCMPIEYFKECIFVRGTPAFKYKLVWELQNDVSAADNSNLNVDVDPKEPNSRPCTVKRKLPVLA